MKKIFKIFFILTLVAGLIFVVSACKDKEENKDTEITYKDYTVTVVDDFGNPVRDVVVKFTNSDGESKSRVTDERGIAVYKNAVSGKYIVKVEKGLSEVIVKRSEFQLTPDNNTLTVVVRDAKKTIDIYGAVEDGAYAHIISEGEFKFTSTEGSRVYFLVNFNLPGKYSVSFVSGDKDMTVGYYGNPMIVQENHLADGEYDGKSFVLDVHDPTAPYVLALDYTEDTEATLVVKRIGDADFNPSYDVPVVSVDTKREDLQKFTLPENAVLTDIDITDKNLTVELRDDGYYYTSDGKLIYLRISSVGNHDNMNIQIPSIKEMLALGTDPDAPVVVGGINFGGFVFDENGDYIEKRIYNDMMES